MDTRESAVISTVDNVHCLSRYTKISIVPKETEWQVADNFLQMLKTELEN